MGSPEIKCSIVALERAILQRICARDIAVRGVKSAIRALSDYAWQESEHATVFQAIQRTATSLQTHWQDELPAQATRMGFPDVDWSRYLSAENQSGCAQVDLDDLITRIANTKR